MAELANSQGDSAQNEATRADKERPSKGKLKSFVDNGEEFLMNLARTVEKLTGPSGSLQTLEKAVKSLKEEVNDMKRKPEEQSGQMEGSSCSSVKRAKTGLTAEGKESSQRESNSSQIDLTASTSTASTSKASTSTGASVLEENSETEELDTLFPEESEEELEPDEQDILEDLDQYFEPQTETGGKVDDKLATLVDRALHENPKEEKVKKLMEKYKRPENIHNLQIPKIDHTLWRALDRSTRSVDLQLQKNMDTMARCMGPTIKMLEVLMNPTTNPKDDLRKLKDLTTDSFKLIANSICNNIHQRKERIQKEKQLKPRVKTILKEATTSATQLFGDKLKEEMKVLSEKSVMLTLENGIDKSNSRSNQHFLSKTGGQNYQRRHQNPPYKNYRNKQPYNSYGRPQQQNYKKGPGAKNSNKKQ